MHISCYLCAEYRAGCTQVVTKYLEILNQVMKNLQTHENSKDTLEYRRRSFLRVYYSNENAIVLRQFVLKKTDKVINYN